MGQILDLNDALLALGLSSPSEEELAVVTQAITSAEGAVVRHLKYNPVLTTHTEYYPQQDFSSQSRESLYEVDSNKAFIRRLAEQATEELQLKHIPLRSIVDLRIDYDGRFGTRAGSFGPDTVMVEGTDYWSRFDLVDSENAPVCVDGIVRSSGRWPSVDGSIRVEYVAGYKESELSGADSILNASPIRESVLDETVRRVHRRYSRMKNTRVGFSGPLSSEHLGDYSYNVDTALLQRLVAGNDLLPETRERLADFVHYGQEL